MSLGEASIYVDREMVMNYFKKWLSLAWSKGLYPRPEPLPRTRSFWVAFGLVALAALAYVIYFSIFVTAKQNAFKTNGEDLGIIDQALWSLLHGSLFHQTICNVLTDTNCAGLNGVSRFAIHFEPVLFLISLLYVFRPDPTALMILQVVVVASGAFPAFWLARLRLRNAWAGIPFALLYLLYPAQQYAVNFDFHAVTLVIALLLFALYFLYTRNTLWLFVFVVLCLACKEEIAGVIFMLGLWAVLLQRQRLVGLGLIALSICWTMVTLIVMHVASPIGHSLLASRYTYLGSGPVQIALTILTHPVSIVQQHVLEPTHMLYLRKLLAPVGYLPLLAPWALALAAPTLALNLLSSDPNMYSGGGQYNAEIVPILIFASIEATVLIMWALRWLIASARVEHESRESEASDRPAAARVYRLSPVRLLYAAVLALVLGLVLARAINYTTEYNVYGVMPYARGFIWPRATPHTRLASQFMAEIPSNASVTTQTALVPHLSERKNIYLFPYAVNYAEYILLDARGYVYPFKNYSSYAASVKTILQDGNYGVVNLQDGYLLLKKGYSAPDISPALEMIDDDAHTD